MLNRTEFEDVVKDISPALVGSMVIYTGDREMAEEVAQEAFARLWERRQSVREPRPWLFKVSFNIANSTLRRRRLRDRAIAALALVESSPGDHDPFADQTWLRDAVAKLTRRQREVTTRFYYVDQSIAEIAEATGLAAGTVKAHLHAARSHLRIALNNTGENDHESQNRRGQQHRTDVDPTSW